LTRKRPGDFTHFERQFWLEKINRHLEELLAKANRDKDMLRHKKHQYWARMHVGKARINILKRSLNRELIWRKRPNPLWILAEASVSEHDT